MQAACATTRHPLCAQIDVSTPSPPAAVVADHTLAPGGARHVYFSRSSAARSSRTCARSSASAASWRCICVCSRPTSSASSAIDAFGGRPGALNGARGGACAAPCRIGADGQCCAPDMKLVYDSRAAHGAAATAAITAGARHAVPRRSRRSLRVRRAQRRRTRPRPRRLLHKNLQCVLMRIHSKGGGRAMDVFQYCAWRAARARGGAAVVAISPSLHGAYHAVASYTATTSLFAHDLVVRCTKTCNAFLCASTQRGGGRAMDTTMRAAGTRTRDLTRCNTTQARVNNARAAGRPANVARPAPSARGGRRGTAADRPRPADRGARARGDPRARRGGGGRDRGGGRRRG